MRADTVSGALPDIKLMARNQRHNTQLLSGRGAVRRAAELLRGGELVAIPTETVYGLAGDAGNSQACKSIYAAKGRPRDNPLIVHFSSLGDIRRHAGEYGIVLNPVIVRLLRRCGPGPLTVIVPRAVGEPVPGGRKALCPEVSAGLPTVAVRIPRHRLARRLLRRCGGPLAAPSANRSGLLSATNAHIAYGQLRGRIAAVLDGGAAAIGVESTIVRYQGGGLEILRAGAIGARKIKRWVGEQCTDVREADGGAVAVAYPGSRHRHYRPVARVEPFTGNSLAGAAPDAGGSGGEGGSALIISRDCWRMLLQNGKQMVPVGIFCINRDGRVHVRQRTIPAPACLGRLAVSHLFIYRSVRQYAQHLFGLYQACDTAGVTRVLAERPPAHTPLGTAINDRLTRSARS